MSVSEIPGDGLNGVEERNFPATWLAGRIRQVDENTSEEVDDERTALRIAIWNMV